MLSVIDLATTNYTRDQIRALLLMDKGENVFLTGGAGTGKSFVIEQFIRLHPDKYIVATASTGTAAIDIGGMTLHRAFKIPGDLLKCPRRPTPASIDRIPFLKKVDTIIIDEISMCRFDVFNYFAYSIKLAQERYKKKYQVIVVGDFYQLPPVLKQQDIYDAQKQWNVPYNFKGYAFKTEGWNKFFNFKTIVLHQVVRQKSDQSFVNALNKVREGDTSVLDWIYNHANKSIISDGIQIHGWKRKVEEDNYKKLAKLPGKEYSFPIEITGIVDKSDIVPPHLLKIKKGARVMSLVNGDTLADMPGRSYANGSLGTVEDIIEDPETHIVEIKVKFDTGNTESIYRNKWKILEYPDEKTRKIKKITKDPNAFNMADAKDVDADDGSFEKGSYTQFPLNLAYSITIHKSQGKTFDKVNLDPNSFETGQLYVALSRATSLEGLHFLQKPKSRDLLTDPKVTQFYRDAETYSNSPKLQEKIEAIVLKHRQLAIDNADRMAKEAAAAKEAILKRKAAEEAARKKKEAKEREYAKEKEDWTNHPPVAADNAKEQWDTLLGKKVFCEDVGIGTVIDVDAKFDLFTAEFFDHEIKKFPRRMLALDYSIK